MGFDVGFRWEKSLYDGPPKTHAPDNRPDTQRLSPERLACTRFPRRYRISLSHKLLLSYLYRCRVIHSSYLIRIIIHKNEGKNTAAALPDVEKAFDKVWHAGVFYRLVALGVPCPQLVNGLKSFLRTRLFHIKGNSFNSGWHVLELPSFSASFPNLHK